LVGRSWSTSAPWHHRHRRPAIGMVYRSDRATSIGIVAVALG
jgi:hypothetical protein